MGGGGVGVGGGVGEWGGWMGMGGGGVDGGWRWGMEVGCGGVGGVGARWLGGWRVDEGWWPGDGRAGSEWTMKICQICGGPR